MISYLTYGFSLLLSLLSFAGYALDPHSLEKAEKTLNEIKTLEAQFIQETEKGGILRGKFSLSKPGKLKFVYEEPAPFLLVANGESLIYVDYATQQSTYFPLDSGPLSLLLQKTVAFSTVGKVLKYWEQGEWFKVLIEDKNGLQITLEFDKNTFVLKGWSLIDAQGKKIRIRLTEMHLNKKVDPSLFVYRQPPKWKIKRQNKVGNRAP